MSAVLMLNSVGERTPPWGTPVLNGCVVSLCCVGFASIDVFGNELYDCAWNVSL